MFLYGILREVIDLLKFNDREDCFIMFYENKNSKREILFPVRVVESEGKISNIDALLREKPLQIGLSEKDYCSICNSGYFSIMLS